MNIPVSFRVSGNELAAYMDTIRQKSADQANEAILSAKEQTSVGKEQIQIINSQIDANERRTRMELQATRSILMERKRLAIAENEDEWEKRRGIIGSDAKSGKIDYETAKKDIDETYRGQRSDKSDINSDYQDQVHQMREDEMLQRAILQSNRDQVDELKKNAQENIKAIKGGDKTLADVFTNSHTEDERLVARLTQEGLREKKEKRDSEKGGGIFGSLLAIDNLNKSIQLAGVAVNSNNGFDLIAPASNLAGKIIGGIVGGAIGAYTTGGFGTAAGVTGGIAIGGALGDTFGSFQQKTAILKEEYYKNRYKYFATTGINAEGNSDTRESGVDGLSYMSMRREYAKRRGYEIGSDKTTTDAIYTERGLGIEQSTSAGIIDFQRSAKENNRDLAGIITGIREKGQINGILKGNDTTFLNEFLNRFASLQKELLRTQNIVATGTTMDILGKFNSMGGMLEARDPRSAGIISGINSTLQNPASDNVKALEFGVLRSKMKGASLFQLREEQARGLGSHFLLKGMVEEVDRMGGTEDERMNQLSGMFPSVPLAAIRTIYENRKKLKNWDTSELKGVGLSDEVLKQKSIGNTTDIEKNAANLNNAILSNTAIEAMAKAFDNAITTSLSGAVIKLNNGQGTITFMSKSEAALDLIQTNKTKASKNIQDLSDFGKSFNKQMTGSESGTFFK